MHQPRNRLAPHGRRRLAVFVGVRDPIGCDTREAAVKVPSPVKMGTMGNSRAECLCELRAFLGQLVAAVVYRLEKGCRSPGSDVSLRRMAFGPFKHEPTSANTQFLKYEFPKVC